MILDITTFDHPALRTPGTRIEKIDARIRDLANDMIEIFIKGGPIMWPLLALSLVAFTVVLERLVFIVMEK